MNKIGVDTNIFIYTLDKSSPHHLKCDSFLKDTSNDLFTTTKNISEYFAVCSKLGIDKEKVIGFYNEIKNNITILYPSSESLKTFVLLIDYYQPKGNRVYDVEIVSILATNKVSKIATVNIDDFKNISEIELIDLDNYK
jgi:predicted nucleic acid-binding protein